MREIKFRAWDEQNKVMHNEVEFIRSGIDGNDWILFKSDKQKLEDGNVLNNPYFQQQIKLMQYTGLKDKNDVEIYEGDIVSFTLFDCFDNDMQHIGKILFNNGAFYIEYMDKDELYNSLLCYVISQDDEFEVIGNIHENPELLESK